MTSGREPRPEPATKSGRPGPARALAVSSWSWHAAHYAGGWSLLELPAAAASVGINLIECNDFMLPPPRFSRVRRPLLSLVPGAPVELWRYSRDTVQKLSALAAENRVTVLAWTINSDFAVPTQHWPAQKLYLRCGVAATRRLRAPLLRVNLGGSPETPPSRDKEIIRRLVEFVGDSQRQHPGVTITVENHWGISTDIDRHLFIVDAVAAQLQSSLRARFGCCFDPANMPGNPERERWWLELARRANHYHLKTTTVRPGGDSESLPHAALFELLHKIGFRGAVTIEFAGEGTVAEGVKQGARLFLEYGEC